MSKRCSKKIDPLLQLKREIFSSYIISTPKMSEIFSAREGLPFDHGDIIDNNNSGIRIKVMTLFSYFLSFFILQFKEKNHELSEKVLRQADCNTIKDERNKLREDVHRYEIENKR